MIFVILGTQKFQLNRLLRKLDKYIEQGLITEEVVAQIGFSDYLPKHFMHYDFLNKEEFDQMIAEADVVIAHSGVGSIITALGAGKPVVVFPRLSRYKEHIDDHQLDIAHAFSKKKYVLCCNEEDSLLDKIEESRTFHFETYVSQRERIVGIIRDYLEKC